MSPARPKGQFRGRIPWLDSGAGPAVGATTAVEATARDGAASGVVTGFAVATGADGAAATAGSAGLAGFGAAAASLLPGSPAGPLFFSRKRFSPLSKFAGLWEASDRWLSLSAAATKPAAHTNTEKNRTMRRRFPREVWVEIVAGMVAGEDCCGEEITRATLRKLFISRKIFISDQSVRGLLIPTRLGASGNLWLAEVAPAHVSSPTSRHG